MDSTVSHDELSSKLKLAVLGVISTALAGKKGRIIQYPFQFFRITHNLNTVALMMKFCSTWALGQILHLRPCRAPGPGRGWRAELARAGNTERARPRAIASRAARHAGAASRNVLSKVEKVTRQVCALRSVRKGPAVPEP